MAIRVVRVICKADGDPTPHDGKYVVEWDPHTKAGTLLMTSTSDINRAKRFKDGQELVEWNTVSTVQPVRPWDGKPNKPLTGITVESINVED